MENSNLIAAIVLVFLAVAAIIQALGWLQSGRASLRSVMGGRREGSPARFWMSIGFNGLFAMLAIVGALKLFFSPELPR
jgi:hypothetical protein